jgi:hypothetical protein
VFSYRLCGATLSFQHRQQDVDIFEQLPTAATIPSVGEKINKKRVKNTEINFRILSRQAREAAIRKLRV